MSGALRFSKAERVATLELLEVIDGGGRVPTSRRSLALKLEAAGYLRFLPYFDLQLTQAGKDYLRTLRSSRALSARLAAISFDAKEHAEAEELDKVGRKL